ncbi:phytanoyl-CoA dioxygenase family protein [Occallatibacter savannae]|uniref:phytanoyl-CoA dioxygenase family protein n=1 Tax=Occallatibacter savannae TaxID=1002691 RepID=UPI000D69377C|nr:phytanoyl-CoA dioxygenase family protein [Occallatibacter savannae]
MSDYSTSTAYVVKEVRDVGFSTLSGPLATERFNTLRDAYDEAMAAAHEPHFKVGSTTTRLSNLLSFSPIFDEVFLHEPLLEACSEFMDGDFKLSSFLGRTLRAGTPAQALHADLPRSSQDSPLLGFILMIDPFRNSNGATRFVPGSHRWPGPPDDLMVGTRAPHPEEVLACGEVGTLILFDGAIWHGHTANTTSQGRRSIQGYFVRRAVRQGFDFRNGLPSQVQVRMSALARHVLALDGD